METSCGSKFSFIPVIMVLIGLVALGAGICSNANAQIVVASTSLTGAIAKAAGAKEVRILTPLEIKHPPEYELKPSDLQKLEGATAVVYAGYERMVERLAESSRNSKLTAIKVDTTTSPENLIAETRRLSMALHTEQTQLKWQNNFTERLRLLKSRLAPLTGKTAVVHFHTKPFAEWAGLSIVQIIPPGELSLKLVADSVARHPDIVVDILHMPAAKVVADNAHCRYAQLINFPAVDGTATLDDVFEYNTAQLLKAFEKKQ